MDDVDDINPLLSYFETAQFDSASVACGCENYYRSGKWQGINIPTLISYSHAKLRRLAPLSIAIFVDSAWVLLVFYC